MQLVGKFAFNDMMAPTWRWNSLFEVVRVNCVEIVELKGIRTELHWKWVKNCHNCFAVFSPCIAIFFIRNRDIAVLKLPLNGVHLMQRKGNEIIAW